MMKRSHSKYVALAILLWIMSVSGCLFFKSDTCNNMPTFKTMEAGSSLVLSDQSADLTVKFTTGLELPIAYYRSAALSRASQNPYGEPWDNHFAVLNGFEARADALVLQLLKSSLDSDEQPLSFHFIFPDRRGYIDCEHPGSADAYYLDLSFMVTRSGNSFAVGSFRWKEKLRKGPF
jgi:hypothetical protein